MARIFVAWGFIKRVKVGDLVKHRYSDRVGIVMDIKEYLLDNEVGGKGIIVHFFDGDLSQPHNYWISALEVISENR